MTRSTITVGIPTYNRAALLRQTLESVLSQTYPDFRVVISDNASTDDTADVVTAYRDTRIEYLRSEQNIGMVGNFNRLIEVANTDFLMLLSDDDLLYPQYLASVVGVLQGHPSVGLVHTAFDEIDADSHVRRHRVSAMSTKGALTIETRQRFLERSMTALPLCFSTAACRTCAMRHAGRMIAGEELFADVPLVLRIALDWDVAYVDRPLVAFRLHDETQTRRISERGTSGRPTGNDRLLVYGQALLDRRIRFIDDADLPAVTANRYRALATLRSLVDRAGLDTPWPKAMAEFIRLLRCYPKILVSPLSWRFLTAQLGGRRLRRAMRRFIMVRAPSSDATAR